jgi:hypothetical protein
MSTAATSAPNISADAGDEKTLSNPNSPEAIARRAKEAEVQSSEDQRFDAPPPKRTSGFQDYIVVWEDEQKRSGEITAGLFLALGTLLFLYQAAPDGL